MVRASLIAPDGSVLATTDTASGPDGAYSAAFPGGATAGLEPDAVTGYVLGLGVAIEVLATDAPEGTAPQPVAIEHVVLAAPPQTLVLANDFTSSVGWVKPGEQCPFRLIVRNFAEDPAGAAVVTLPARQGTASLNPDGSILWTLGAVAGGDVDDPTEAILVVQAQADSLAEDEQIVWKDLSTTAQLTATGIETATASHGPRVIPPNQTYETARYGDRPLPVVPVAYRDRAALDDNSGAELTTVINDPGFAGSTFNLFQEMSYGQLYPNGTVPSAGIATAGFAGFDNTAFHERQNPAPDADSCFGDYTPGATGTAGYEQRIVNGFYQLPGTTGYYGSDSGETGDATVDADGSIDDACGTIGKIVYDAAALADPEIDYNQFDTDKDGVVDFFMLFFAGCGGNGPSQRAAVTAMTSRTSRMTTSGRTPRP